LIRQEFRFDFVDLIISFFSRVKKGKPNYFNQFDHRIRPRYVPIRIQCISDTDWYTTNSRTFVPWWIRTYAIIDLERTQQNSLEIKCFQHELDITPSIFLWWFLLSKLYIINLIYRFINIYLSNTQLITNALYFLEWYNILFYFYF
jgi:hypothetical protein